MNSYIASQILIFGQTVHGHSIVAYVKLSPNNNIFNIKLNSV